MISCESEPLFCMREWTRCERTNGSLSAGELTKGRSIIKWNKIGVALCHGIIITRCFENRPWSPHLFIMGLEMILPLFITVIKKHVYRRGRETKMMIINWFGIYLSAELKDFEFVLGAGGFGIRISDPPPLFVQILVVISAMSTEDGHHGLEMT